MGRWVGRTEGRWGIRNQELGTVPITDEMTYLYRSCLVIGSFFCIQGNCFSFCEEEFDLDRAKLNQIAVL